MAFAQSGSSVNVGREIADINPEVLGFSALGHGLEGAKKLKLLPSPWPTNNVPPACATLFSIASRRGLLAAASPDTLIIASTDRVRKSFSEEAGDNDIVSNFRPDVTLSVPQLRHVAFSSDEDSLIISAENGGGLAVYGVDNLLKGNKEPRLQISTNDTPVRALLPNPAVGHYMAVVLESGRMEVVDIASDKVIPVRSEGITCAAWSLKGKAFVAGFEDGTATALMVGTNKQVCEIPRPPEVAASYTLTTILWLKKDEFFLIHSPEPSSAGGDAMEEEQDTHFHFVTSDNEYKSFSFNKAPFPLLFPPMEGDAPSRKPPPRYSIARLRNWEPLLNDMLILASANSSDITVLLNTSEKIAPDQEATHEFQRAGLIDSRMAQVPRTCLGEDGESVLIGEALDLSSKDKVTRPAPRLEEINESSTPLPAYMVLTHEGILSAWWVVWDKSVEAGTGYHGLTTLRESAGEQTPAKAAPHQPSSQASSMFAQPSATFGTPATSKFGSTGLPSATPSFGTPSFGKPSQPAFGSPSQVGGAAATSFGTTGLGNRQSPWGGTSQAQTSQAPANPFASAAGITSGFGKLGTTSNTSGSAFSSFGSASGVQSGFGALGQQRSAFAGTSGAFKGLSTEPSFGSTVSLASGTGSTIPSWANTPAQQGGSGFGMGTSSFGSNKESDTSSVDVQNRERDEATPTPQFPPPQSKGLFGLNSGDFKLESSFKSDGSAKEDEEKPTETSNGSFFGGDFGSALGKSNVKSPSTPNKPEQASSEDVSTTPATLPKPASFMFPGTTPKAPPVKQEVVPENAPLPPDPSTWRPPKDQDAPEDAPLPPDPMSYKPPKTDDDLPPLAGSPPIKVEAPESSEPSSPLDDEEEDEENDELSVEEQEDDEEEEEEEETEEPSPSDAARRSRPSQSGYSFQDSVNQSPRIYPAAPTPPSGRDVSPARPPAFGQQFKPVPSPFGQPSKPSPLSFGQSATGAQSTPSGGFPKAPLSFAPSNRTQNLRSPSPVRAVSTSAIGGTRREPMTLSGTSLSASIQQQPKPPTPQPEVSDLVDDEDDRIRQELASEIEPTRTLDDFLARTEYSGPSAGKTGHAAQIEIVYRDINNMVDTLGLNWRSLKAFLEYHERPQRYTELTRADLEEVVSQGEDGPWFEKWSLTEMEDLKHLENDLEQELDEGRLQNVLEKLNQLGRLLREKAKLMTKFNDIRRQVINRKDPDKVETLRKASLPKELADQQKALRNDYARLLALLGQAEEAVMLLRSKLASHSAENGKTGAVPTVDAVKKTVNKLIMITEKKNNDITMLEAQLRKVGLSASSRPTSSSSNHVLGTPSRRSRATRGESPFATPPTGRSRMSLSELNRMALTPEVENTPTKGYGLYYTPEGSPTSGKNLSKLGDFVDDNLPALRETARRRRKIAEGLASALVDRGVKETKVN